MSPNTKVLVACSIGVAIVGGGIAATLAQSADVNHCRFSPGRADSVDFPSRHAWNLFLTLMHPAKASSTQRGQPDCSKPIGTPGTTIVWETWRLARTEVFLSDGSEPPEWNDRSLPSGFQGKVPGDDQSFHGNAVRKSASTQLRRSVTPGSSRIASKGPKPLFDPEPDNSIFVDSGGIGETRMNRSTYEFIRENCLFSREGLDRYAKALREGKKPPIILPSDSIEGKAVWLELTSQQLSSGVDKTYYTIKHDGKTYGLNSFHILTKDIPNWFWATFHHRSTPKNEFETPDTYGRPRDVQGTIWENYVLGGTQIDFISSTGEPTVLSDHFIEFEFQRSSCITCHAMATTATDPNDRNRPRQTIDLGVPDPAKFKKDGKLFYVQTDFLWSMPFRAQSETKSPPARCMW